MSTPHSQDLDLHIQFSLVTRIRQAAELFHAAPASCSSEALETYLCELEGLADYVAAKWRGERPVFDISAAAPRLLARPKSPAKQDSTARIIPFCPAGGGPGSFTPLTAA